MRSKTEDKPTKPESELEPDSYVEAAAKLFQIPTSEVTLEQRKFAKVVVSGTVR